MGSNCIICKNNISFLQGKKISAGMICPACFQKVPSVIKKNLILNEYQTDSLISIVEWTEEYHNINVKKFERTASYGILHIDEMHGLFAICENNKIKKDKLPQDCYDIFHCLNISDFGISMDSASAMNEIVSADVVLQCELDIPKLHFKKKIKNNVKCATERKDSETLVFSEPKDLIMFRTQFDRMYKSNIEKYNYIMQNDFINKHAVDLLLARSLFMVDEGYTSDEIKKQRNRLIKTFHPDGKQDNDDMTEYAKRINDAYRLLLDNLKET